MRNLLILVVFLTFNLVSSQNDFKRDSITISEYKKKVIQYINPNPDSALYYIKKSFKVTKKSNYQRGIADTEYLYAHYFKRTQQIDSALIYFKKSARRAERENYNIGAGIAYNGLCRNLYVLDDYNEAEICCNKALRNLNSDSELSYMTKADTYIALGTIYMRQDLIEKAQAYFLKVDSMHLKKPLRPDVIAAAYQNLGGLYLKFNDLNLAESYYLKANDQFEKLPAAATEYYMSTNNLELGKLYYQQRKLDKADSVLTNSHAYFLKIQDFRNASESATQLAQIKIIKEQFNAAEVLFTESFEFYEASKADLEAATNALELAKLALLKDNFEMALTWSQIGNQINKNINNSLIEKEIAFVMADAYTALSQYKTANAYNEIGYRIKDSLDQIQTAEKIKEIEGKYQTANRDKVITSLRSQNELALQQKKNQRNLMLGAIGVTTIGGLFLFVLYRNRQKTNTKLKELDELKSNFFTNISHEFRTPLTLITSPIDDLLLEETLSDKKRQQFTVAKQNSQRLLELVNQLLELSKIDAGQLKLNIQPGHVLQLVSSLTDSFEYHAEQNNIVYTVNIAKDENLVWFDKDAVEKITVNLLSNAIKYTPKNGYVSCQAYIEANTLFMEVRNSGKGLTIDESQHIFERFYQTNEQNKGTGIGLALVKELIELHKGAIEVKSQPNAETIFELSLSVDKNHFKNELIKESSDIEAPIEIPFYADMESEDDGITDNDLPIVLIVEDNTDLRKLLKQTFEDTYNVISASNGAVGVELALEQIPDLIISDIMMPKKDGITLTKELKSDERSSHIPIILLTAKAGVESQFKGIDMGADDYITKPFDKKLLVLKVEKLIALRRQLQLRYSQELVLMPKDIAITNLDEKFLEKVQAILEINLVESSFSITDFSDAVGMSRMQLHRKLKALTGLTATEFIRSQRLKLAAQLLKTSDINISQVGYSVGFNDHSYFTKCFKEAYNCTPTEFVGRN